MEFNLDLNDLENSENAIIDGGNNAAPESNNIKITSEASVEETQANPEQEQGLTFDINDIESLGSIFTTNEQGSTEEISGSNAPAETNSLENKDAFSSFAATLKSAGVFSSLEDDEISEIKSTEDLVKIVEKEIKHNKFKGLTERQRNYIEAVESGMPEDKAVSYQNALKTYEQVTNESIENSVALREELFKRNFLIKGFDEASAIKNAKAVAKLEDSVEEAKNVKKSLIAHIQQTFEAEKQENVKLQQEKIDKETQMLSELKSSLNETSQVLPGITVNSQTKEKIFNSLVTPVEENEGNPLNEVMKSYKQDNAYKLRLHALHVITNGFKDFSKFKNTSKSEVIKQFDEVISTNSFTSNVKSVEGSTTNAIKEALANLKF